MTDKQRTARAIAAEEEARAAARATLEDPDYPEAWADEVGSYNARIDEMHADIAKLPGGWDDEAQAAYDEARAEYARERA